MNNQGTSMRKGNRPRPNPQTNESEKPAPQSRPPRQNHSVKQQRGPKPSKPQTTKTESLEKAHKPIRPERTEPTPKPEKRKAPVRMVFAVEASYSLAAVAEGDRLTDFWIEEEKRVDAGTSGNIYRGVITKVLPSLNAAFINIGLEKDGFLSYADIVPTQLQSRRHPKGRRPPIEEIIKVGDKMLVQMEKEPIGDKGPAMTAKISLPGRFLVYMPHTDAVRMSRMLSEEEKKRFRALIREKFDLQGGLIFRTASKGHGLEEIQYDYDYLIRMWRRIEREFEEGAGPKLIHKELELFERVLRDEFSPEVSEIVIDHPRLKHRLSTFLRVMAPNTRPDSLIQFNRNKDLSVWKACNLERDIDQLFSNYVYLKSGSYIIIEEMETLVAIDVNTGKNIAGKNQEETIVQTNLEAAAEITRQLRLRQIGGIIIIDFIDMKHRKDQDRVFKLLEEELAKDRTPSDLKHFTDLGLIQVTRQRSGKSLTKRLTYMCPHCHGSGRRPSIALP